jgi:hypothetical protein
MPGGGGSSSKNLETNILGNSESANVGYSGACNIIGSHATGFGQYKKKKK